MKDEALLKIVIPEKSGFFRAQAGESFFNRGRNRRHMMAIGAACAKTTQRPTTRP
jgi:hypothetical protein